MKALASRRERRWCAPLALALCWAGVASIAAAQPDADLSLAQSADASTEPEGGGAAAPPTIDDATLAALMAEPTGDIAIDHDGPSLDLYGFGDFVLMKSFPERSFGTFPPKTVVMTVGNVNLYAAANLTHGFSSLLEVRFSFLPNGSIDPTTFQPRTTTSFDYADWNRPTQWGSVVLERFHLDYSYNGMLNVRAGMWLTPYGIWNVDHGSPTVIPVNKPYSVGEQLIPTRQTGFQVYGSGLFGSTTLGYSLTLSNGRGDIQYLDLDKNKAVGGRVFMTRSEIGTFTLGFSAFSGIATREQSLTVQPGNPPIIEGKSADSFKELGLAADLLWEFRNFRIQSEFISSQRVYRDTSRKLASGLGTGSGFIPDHHVWGTYLLLAYRLPWFNIMPYLIGEIFERGYARDQIIVLGGNAVNVRALSGGINVRPVPSVALKLQYSHIAFPSNTDHISIPNLSFQAAWAF